MGSKNLNEKIIYFRSDNIFKKEVEHGQQEFE